MVAFIRASVRSLLLGAVLALAAQPGYATSPTTPTAPAPAGHTEGTRPDDDLHLDGWLIIAGLVGAVVLIAWIASRLGEDQ